MLEKILLTVFGRLVAWSIGAAIAIPALYWITDGQYDIALGLKFSYTIFFLFYAPLMAYLDWRNERKDSEKPNQE